MEIWVDWDSRMSYEEYIVTMTVGCHTVAWIFLWICWTLSGMKMGHRAMGRGMAYWDIACI